jgi:hypothetical protein
MGGKVSKLQYPLLPKFGDAFERTYTTKRATTYAAATRQFHSPAASAGA